MSTTTNSARRPIALMVVYCTLLALTVTLTSQADEMRRTGTDTLAAAREEALRQEAEAAASFFEAHEVVRRLMQEDDQTARDATEGKIVNGVLTSEFPTVGALLTGETENDWSTWCTGTMVGCSTFLTARHCVKSKVNSSEPAGKAEYGRFRVFLQHGGIFGVSAIATRKDYAFPHADIAVLTLDRPIDGITPTVLNAGTVIENGTPGVIVGYGRSGGRRVDYGLKRTGRVITGTCTRPEKSLLCWDFDVAGPPGESSNTCNADSGGPLFVDQADANLPVPMLAGITSGGTRADCLLSDNSYDVDVRQFADWISKQTKDPLGAASCGKLPQWGSSKVVSHYDSGKIDPQKMSAVTSVDVPAGTSVLRLAMNAEDHYGEIDFDFFAKHGTPPTSDDADCSRTTGSQYAFCEFENPRPGRWYLAVTRKKGSGIFQITSTAFLQ